MRLLTTDEVLFKIGRSKTTLYRWWKIKGIFPKPKMENGRAIGWRDEDVDNFLRENN